MGELAKLPKLALFVLLAGLICPGDKAEAMDIIATGNWSSTIDASDLVAGPGSDLISTYQSNSDQTLLTVSNTTGNDDVWRVDVKRTDTNWHNDFVFYVKRTGDGTGGGSITGGNTYQEVGTTNSSFFSGSGDRSNITIQLQLSGMSIQVPPDTYSTTITCTVVDTL